MNLNNKKFQTTLKYVAQYSGKQIIYLFPF